MPDDRHLSGEPTPRGLDADRIYSSLRARIFGEPEDPPTLGRYRVGVRLGAGGMGVVFRGVSPSGRTVALKTLRAPSSDAIARLKDEFRCVAELGHVALAAVHELALDRARGQWFIAMEYVPGVMWSELPPERLRGALEQLAGGLHALHAEGLLHRDLKPSNVLVTPEGQLKIVDFGLAQAQDAADASASGTPGYLAPERLRGRPASAASDWYSVGVMLFEALAGRPLTTPPRLPPEVDPELARLCRDLLADDPAARPSGAEVLTRLGLPLPRARLATFVGRSRELAACRAALRDPPALLLLDGPSGAGKSALLRHLVEGLRDAGALALRGRCYPGDGAPFNALDEVMDALTEHLAACPADQRPPSLDRGAAAIARLFPTFTRSRQHEPAREVPREARRRGVAALRRLLVELARQRPLVLAIDDLQWGDADSARLLVELLEGPEPPRVLVIAAVRGEDRPRSPFFAELAVAAPTCAQITVRVEPLGPDDARALATTLLRTHAPDAPDLERRAADIATESRGNPFFIETLSRQTGLESLPLERALQALLAELDPHTRDALARLAVAGRPLPRDLAAPGPDASPLHRLRALRLARVGPDCDSLETYHDRVRVAVLATLSRERLRGHHLALARDLGALPGPDPVEIAAHLHAGGDLPEAAAWALRAAERAAAALAFARAADHYRDVLSWGTFSREQVLQYTLARADALANAGRCGDAAPLLLAAAALAPTREAELELRGRAVEHYFVSGRVDAGLALIRPLARELGLPFPDGPGLTVAHLLAEFARLSLARATRRRDAPEPADRLRVDACWSIGKGLGFIDPVRAATFSARGLRLALRLGDPQRLARAEAYFALMGVNERAPAVAARAEATIAAARRVAQEVDDPHLIGLTAVLSGVAAMNNGRWRASLAELEAGTEVLRVRCVGVTWERGVAQAMNMHALLMLGDFDALAAASSSSARESAAAGDRFSEVVAILYLGHVALAADEPRRAREHVLRALSLWPYERFSFQHWLALAVEVGADLLEARPADAWTRAERAWAQARRSLLMRMQIPRIDLHMLRASAALALAADTREPGLLRVAARHAAALRRERIELARSGAALIDAQIALLKRSPAAADALESAAAGFARADMPAHAAALRLRLGTLDAQAHAGTGVKRLDRWASLVAPALP